VTKATSGGSCALATVLILASSLAVYPEPAGATDSLGKRFSAADFEAIRSPERVESLPVENLADPSKDWKDGMKTSLPGSFRVLPEPLPVDKDTAADLARLLLRSGSYGRGYSGVSSSREPRFASGEAVGLWTSSSVFVVRISAFRSSARAMRCSASSRLGRSELGLPDWSARRGQPIPVSRT
jgi:hypothetical protein